MSERKKRLTCDQVQSRFVGKKFRRRRWGSTITLRVIDSTLGGDVITKRRGCQDEHWKQEQFLDWVTGATEL